MTTKLIPFMLDESDFYTLVDSLALSERFHARSSRTVWEDNEDTRRIQALQARLHGAMDAAEAE